MNKAIIKYNKILCVSGQFRDSATTFQGDIVAMLRQRKEDKKRNPNKDETSTDMTKSIKRKPPSFATHYQNSQGITYKISNTIDYNGTTFHFCDCTLYQNKLKWHTHHPHKCRIYNRWLEEPPPPPITLQIIHHTTLGLKIRHMRQTSSLWMIKPLPVLLQSLQLTFMHFLYL